LKYYAIQEEFTAKPVLSGQYNDKKCNRSGNLLIFTYRFSRNNSLAEITDIYSFYKTSFKIG
jgi:hypothetical protein